VTCHIAADPRWVGIIEVLVAGLDGSVRWEPDSVVLRLPGRSGVDRDADLEALRLCLSRFDLPVVLDACPVSMPDDSLVEFLRKLMDAGLTVGIAEVAA
jgi:hypothetical protein